MGLSDELRELKELHESGALTDDEFAQAKATLLDERKSRAGRAPVRAETSEGSLGQAANTFVKFQIVMAVVGVVIMLVFFFGFFLPGWKESQARFDERSDRFDRLFEKTPGFPVDDR